MEKNIKNIIKGGVLLGSIGFFTNNVFACPCSDYTCPHSLGQPQGVYDGTIGFGHTPNNYVYRTSMYNQTFGEYMNLEKDFGLPKRISDFSFVKQYGCDFRGIGCYERCDGKAFNTSMWKANVGDYGLYDENGEKWGKCVPYFISQSFRIMPEDITVKHLGQIVQDDIGDGHGWTRNLLLYIPYPIDSNGHILKTVNMVTSNGHLNGTMNDKQLTLKLNFY